jgi:hypothetical protein
LKNNDVLSVYVHNPLEEGWAYAVDVGKGRIELTWLELWNETLEQIMCCISKNMKLISLGQVGVNHLEDEREVLGAQEQ